MLHYPSISNSGDIYSAYPHPPAGRRDAHELPLVGTTPGATHYYLISLGDHILDSVMEIGKRGAHNGEELLGSFAAGRDSRRSGVVDDARIEKLIYSIKVPLVYDLLHKPAVEGLVVLCHGEHPLSLACLLRSILGSPTAPVFHVLAVFCTFLLFSHREKSLSERKANEELWG